MSRNSTTTLLLRCFVCLAALASATTLLAVESSTAETKPVEKTVDDAAKKSEEKPAEPAASAPAEPAAGHSMHGEAFDDGPRQHAYLMPGTGKVNFPASTKNNEVRAFINQGVGQLHGFWYFEAERSFRQAAMLEPDCAIAYWGMAMANINNDKRAKGFIAEAVKRKDKASDHEQKYIDALDAYWKADPKKKPERNAAFVKALEDLLFEYPHDLDAKAWMVMTQWQASREGSKVESYLASDALLSEVLAKEPMHPAHHYRIHLWDDKRAAKATGSAALCGPSAPGIAHMWHMPGHTYAKLKRYRDAAWQQEASARVDHAYMMRDRVMPDQIHNFAHNNEWLIRDLVNIGSWQKALGLAKNMTSLPRHPKYNGDKKRGSYYYGRQRLLEVLEKFELWEQTIAMAETPYFQAEDNVAEKTVRLRALGRAYLNKGDKEKGQEQIKALQALLDKEKTDLKKAEEDAEAKVKKDVEKEKDKADAKADVKKDAGQSVADADAMKEEVKPEAPAEEADKESPKPDEEVSPEKSTDEEKDTKSEPAESKPAAESKAEAANDKKPEANEKEESKAADALKKRIDAARKNAGKGFSGKITNLEQAIRELEGWQQLADGQAKDAVKTLEKAKIDPLLLARAQAAAALHQESEKLVRKEVKNRTSEVLPLAALVEVLWKGDKRDDCYKAFEDLRRLSSTIDLDCPVFARLAPIAREFGFTEDWRLPREMPDDLGPRPALDSLGPAHWQPYPAPQWSLTDADGQEHSLKQYEGKPVLVIFYLGYGCLHCAEQLQVFAPMTNDFSAQGISIVAISTDNRDGLTKSLAQCEDGKFPFPLISDAELNVFKAYRVHDDFEQQPLHATMLIDAHGLVRWQDISFEPFKDAKFVLAEAKRLLALPATTTP